MAGETPAKPCDAGSWLPAPRCLEAIQAIDGAGAGRHEGHLRLLPAVGADHVVHCARPAVSLRGAPSCPAFGTAPGLVLKPARLIELLLPRREEEIATAVTALQRPVRETHRLAPPKNVAQRPGRMTGLPPLALRGDFSAPDANLEGRVTEGSKRGYSRSAMDQKRVAGRAVGNAPK
jgi:hypothetical protein